MNKSLLFLFFLLFISFFLLFFFWSLPIVLTIFVIVLWLIKYMNYPIKNEIVFYVVIVFFGGVIELTMINIAAAWAYTAPNFLAMPSFMPFLWGFIGVTLISVYEHLPKMQ